MAPKEQIIKGRVDQMKHLASCLKKMHIESRKHRTLVTHLSNLNIGRLWFYIPICAATVKGF